MKKACSHSPWCEEDKCCCDEWEKQNESGNFLIWSNEHNGWWKPGHCGYTNHRDLAGRYTLETAIKVCRSANKFLAPTHVPNETIQPE